VKTANENNEHMHSKQAKPGQEKKPKSNCPRQVHFALGQGNNGSSSEVSLSTENINVLTHWATGFWYGYRINFYSHSYVN